MKKNQKKMGDTEKHALIVILPMAILSVIYLLLRYPEPETLTSIIFYYASFILILSGVFSLIASVYWGALLFLCGIALIYLTQNFPILNDGINMILFMVDFLLFLPYLTTGTLKRIDRVLLPAVRSARDRRRTAQNAMHANQEKKYPFPSRPSANAGAARIKAKRLPGNLSK